VRHHHARCSHFPVDAQQQVHHLHSVARVQIACTAPSEQREVTGTTAMMTRLYHRPRHRDGEQQQVPRTRRLVQQQQLRTVHQRTCDGDALLFTTCSLTAARTIQRFNTLL
jgi:hypothetical protein